MQFSPTAELMHALANEYDASLDAEREISIEAQEQDEEWLERWERDNYEEHRLELAEYLEER